MPKILPGHCPALRTDVVNHCWSRYIGGMHGINNPHINNGIQEPTQGYQNCTTSHTLICGGWHVKVREAL